MRKKGKGRGNKRDSFEVTVSGTIKMHPRGFGFVQLDSAEYFEQDIFIPKHLTMTAVDGDRVEVKANARSISDKGPEGKVISVISRRRSHIAGIITSIDWTGDLSAYAPILGEEQEVCIKSSSKFVPKIGDRFVMEVVDWGERDTTTVCRLAHYIGSISDPSADIDAAIEEFQIRNEFPSDALEEAASYSEQITEEQLKGREDFRHLECVTIDPETAKDFDDAITIKKKNGGYLLGVHIADVTAFVHANTKLDQEAKIRCNSTYFPGRCVPMLPSHLSDNLCSLKPGVDRLTVSVLMSVDDKGELTDHKIVRSVINSKKRFSYGEAKEVLDGKDSPHAKMLTLMVDLCALLKKKRHERGSVEFAMRELVVKVDKKGMPVKTEQIEYDITHQMIEEFMLKANETVAIHLTKKRKGLPFRVHEQPAEESLKDFSQLALAFGYKLSLIPTPREIQNLFEEAMSTPYGQYLATSYIKRMRLALYSPDNIGHFGLSLDYYCHFTSPIRRYADLVVHRTLFSQEESQEQLEVISSHCSEQERLSAKAEQNVVLLKKLRLLEIWQKKDKKRQYQAIVTRVKPFGISFELIDLMLEGFLHVSKIGNDYYVFDQESGRLVGDQTSQSIFAGEELTVRVKEIDLIYLDCDWEIITSDVNKGLLQKPRRSKR